MELLRGLVLYVLIGWVIIHAIMLAWGCWVGTSGLLRSNSFSFGWA